MMQPIDVQRLFIRPLPESDFAKSRGGAVAARGSHTPKVAGSSPAPATNFPPARCRRRRANNKYWVTFARRIFFRSLLFLAAAFLWVGCGALAALELMR